MQQHTTFVITDGAERLARFNKLFKAAGFKTQPSPWRACMLPDNPVLGCSVSHYSLVQYALAADLPQLIVFEDDATPCDNAYSKMHAAIRKRPKDCLQLTLGWGSVRGKEQTEDYARRTDFEIVVGSHAYALFGREAYTRFLAEWERLGIADRVCDQMDGAFKFVHNLFCQYNDRPCGIHKMPAGWLKDDFRIVGTAPEGFQTSAEVIRGMSGGADAADAPDAVSAPPVKPADIHVAYTVDIQGAGSVQFIDQMLVSMLSLRNTKRPEDTVTAHVFYANITADFLADVLKLNAPGFKVILSKIDQDDLQYMQQFSKYQPQGGARMWSGIVFARLWLANWMEDSDRVIYLDSDTLVRKSLHELWETELPEGKLLGMNFGVVPEYGYNSGVILMDLKGIRGVKDVWGNLDLHLKQFAKEYMLPDQTVINRFFSDAIHPIDRKYNYPPTPGDGNSNEVNDAVVWRFYNQHQKPFRFDIVWWTMHEWNRYLGVLDGIRTSPVVG